MADVEMKPAEASNASGTAASGARPASATSTISVDSDEVMEVDQEISNKGKKKPRRKVRMYQKYYWYLKCVSA